MKYFKTYLYNNKLRTFCVRTCRQPEIETTELDLKPDLSVSVVSKSPVAVQTAYLTGYELLRKLAADKLTWTHQ